MRGIDGDKFSPSENFTESFPRAWNRHYICVQTVIVYTTSCMYCSLYVSRSIFSPRKLKQLYHNPKQNKTSMLQFFLYGLPHVKHGYIMYDVKRTYYFIFACIKQQIRNICISSFYYDSSYIANFVTASSRLLSISSIYSLLFMHIQDFSFP